MVLIRKYQNSGFPHSVQHSQPYILANHITQTYLCFHIMWIWFVNYLSEKMPYPPPPQHPVLSTTSVVTVVPCAVWNVPRSLGTSSSLWVGGPLHYGKREPRWEGVEGGGSGWGGKSVCHLCTVKEGTRECWGDKSGSRYQCVTLVLWRVGH